MADLIIVPAAPVDTHYRTPLISFCTVQLRTPCTANSLVTLCLSTTSGPGPGELPGFWGSMVIRHAPIPRKGSGNQQQQQETCFAHTLHLVVMVGWRKKDFRIESYQKVPSTVSSIKQSTAASEYLRSKNVSIEIAVATPWNSQVSHFKLLLPVATTI